MGLFSTLQHGMRLSKASRSAAPAASRSSETPTPQPSPMSHMLDELDLRSKPDDRYINVHHGTLGLPYSILRTMGRASFVAPIIKRRCDQMAEFGVRQSSRYSVGMRVRLKDPKGKMTRAAERRARELEDMLLAMGGEWGTGHNGRSTGLENYLRMTTRDSLILEQLNAEPLFTRGHKPFALRPIDPETMRLAKPSEQAIRRGYQEPDEIRYVQIVGEHRKVVAEFGRDAMVWGIRRPRTDIRVRGYGFPELDEAYLVLAGLLNAESYQDAVWTNGVHISTILALKSAMQPDMFRATKLILRGMLSGARNAHKTPIIKLNPKDNEELKAIPVSHSNKDMEYANYVNFRIKLVCALLGIDPAEIGFVYGNEGQSSALNQAGPEQRLNYSKASGLRPLVRFHQGILNDRLIEPNDPDFMVELAGLDSMSEQEKLELDCKAVQWFKKLNEVRSEHDLEEIDSPAGEMVMNPHFVQVAMQAAQSEGEDVGAASGAGSFGPVDPLSAMLMGQGDDGGGPEPPPPPANGREQIDRATRTLAAGLEKAMRSGRIVAPGGFPRKAWAPIETVPGVRAWAMEV